MGMTNQEIADFIADMADKIDDQDSFRGAYESDFRSWLAGVDTTMSVLDEFVGSNNAARIALDKLADKIEGLIERERAKSPVS